MPTPRSLSEINSFIGLRRDYNEHPEKITGAKIIFIETRTKTVNDKEYPVVRVVFRYDGAYRLLQDYRQLHWSKFVKQLPDLTLTVAALKRLTYDLQKTEFPVEDPTVESKARWIPVKVN